jgi:hypothetical protein
LVISSKPCMPVADRGKLKVDFFVLLIFDIEIIID